MSTAFSRTLRSLAHDSAAASVAGIAVACVLGAGWTGWCVLGRVTLYEVTAAARIEIEQAPSPVQSPVQGRVVSASMTVGQRVSTGDVLVEIDAQPLELAMQEELRRLEALGPERAALHDQHAAERRASSEEEEAARAAGDEARAALREAEAPARFAEDDVRRLAQLHAGGLVADRDFERATAEARQHRAAAETHQITIHRLEREQRARASDRAARLKRLESEINRIDGQIAASQAALDRLAHEIERRRIRAPMSGTLGESATLRVGAVVQEGDRLGTIVPEGTLTLVASFPPPAALGRIRPGQRARARLQGFPWTQYGTVAATVHRVANEVRDGTVRVELVIEPDSTSRIPLQHGLPGSVEVEVERLSPGALLMRVAGRLIATPAPGRVGAADGGA